MDNLNNIPKSGSYGAGVDLHNDNYQKIGVELQTLRELGQNNKGYFETFADLKAKYPTPQSGWHAYVANVASSSGYYVANVNSSGNWVVTAAEAPPINVDLAGYAKTGGSTKTVKDVEDEIVQLAGEVNLKEVKANKQNSLASDGTGVKFPTVDAVNAKIAEIEAAIEVVRGYWVHKDTGVKTYFGLGDSSIVDGIMNGPSWGEDCSEVKIPLGVTGLGNHCFAECYSLSSITLPIGFKSIGDYCFANCYALTSITLPIGFSSLGANCFSGSSLASITLPEGITNLVDSCFSECPSLTSITLPIGLTSIGDYCFSYCESLSSITIPESVTSIGSSCFYGCTSLTLATVLPAIPPSLGAYAFEELHTSFNIKVRSPYVDDYKTATNWINYSSIISAI